ncbi:recombinase family protein [Microbacterium thalli]|uniref:recombinase family protein n=1 Tax=Microbacterium thalli TaxID=3027921 RepID=UPI0023660938|nr:recombinase family protein [Microbacterium thalli]MDD7929878.1 recombinase family protein [Microbacterium thalli]
MYLRISLDQTGEERAVERQRQDAMKLIQEHERDDWVLHDIYQDNSVSASRREKKREHYDRMVRDYEAGRFSIIVCYNLDRLTRQPSQLEEWIERSEKTGLRIVTLTGEADLGDDDGRLFARIKVSVAKAEVERMGARRKRANEQTVAAGRPAPGRRPYGWEKDGVTLREDEAQVVRSIYSAVLSGDSLRALVRDLNAREVPSPQSTPWTAFKLRQVIDRERNYGALLRYGVEQPTSLIQPIVSKDEHEQAQAIIAGRAQPGRKPEKHLLSGLATCAICERRMGAKGLKSRNAGEREPYYVCNSRINRTHESDGKVHPTIRAHILEARVREEVVKAFLYGPAELFPGSDDGGVAEASVRLQEVRKRIGRVEDAIEAGTMQKGRAASRMAGLHREEAAALAVVTEAQARAATGRFADIRRGLFRPGQRVSFESVAGVRQEMGLRYDALSFDQKRDLIWALLEIRVERGYGAKRARLRHLVVTHLNDDYQEEL